MKKTTMDWNWVHPIWDAPKQVSALFTTRLGGFSQPPYASFNLGDHVGDDLKIVRQNRQLLADSLNVKPIWLSQQHGNGVVWLDETSEDLIEADAAITNRIGIACTVLLADCLPVLLCDRAGTVVAAVHAGWRGLLAGVIEKTVDAMNLSPSRILAYLGPSIGQNCFIVGDDVRDQFLSDDIETSYCFRQMGTRWMADLNALAIHRLESIGINSIRVSGRCTSCDNRFFSHRRDGTTGRFAGLIWINRETIS